MEIQKTHGTEVIKKSDSLRAHIKAEQLQQITEQDTFTEMKEGGN